LPEAAGPSMAMIILKAARFPWAFRPERRS